MPFIVGRASGAGHPLRRRSSEEVGVRGERGLELPAGDDGASASASAGADAGAAAAGKSDADAPGAVGDNHPGSDFSPLVDKRDVVFSTSQMMVSSKVPTLSKLVSYR